MNTVGTTVGGILKELRGNGTQLQLGLDIGVVRETVSKYETGRSKVPADICRTLVEKFDNPKFAITVQHEYTKTGPVWLDGPNVDLHRCSVREKTIEELQEALTSLVSTSMAKPAGAISPLERLNLENMLEEAVEASTALAKFIAVTTEYLGLSYTGVWQRHYENLEQAGYLGGAK